MMRSLLLSILIGICGVAVAAETENPERLIVVLKADALSQGEQVLLSEAATIDAASTAHIDAAKIALGRAEVPGQSRAFIAADVAGAIRRSGCLAGIEMKGAAETKVIAARQVVTGQSMADEVLASVKAELAKDTDLEIDADITSVPADSVLRPGAVEIRPNLPETGLHPGPQSVRDSVSQNNRD